MTRYVWFALLLVVGCTRGCPSNGCTTSSSCNGGGTAQECASDKDCESPLRCRDNYCLAPSSLASLDRCLETPECKRLGACQPGLTRSFLGANSQPTCLVERNEDCAASELCKTQGGCSLLWTTGVYRDGYCAPTTDKHCAVAARCASHDECAFKGVCARSWSGCKGEPLGGFEATHDLGGPWEPGNIDDAILACRIEDDYKQTTSFVRVAGTCVPGPTLGSDTPFLLRTKLTVKDRVEIAIQADPELGTYRNAGYVRAEYTGSSPFTSGTELPRLTCHVVSPAVARANAARMVTRIERGFMRLANERASSEYLIAEPAEAGGIRRVLREAIVWLGSDPQVAKLQASFEAGLVAWRNKLDAAIGKLALSETGPADSRIQVHGFVCGDALKARLKRDVTKDDCGVELVVKATQKMTIGTGINDLGYLKLARRGPEATIVDTELVDVSTRSKPTPVGTVTAEPGEEVTVLVVPRTFLPLAGTRLFTNAGKPRLVLSLDP